MDVTTAVTCDFAQVRDRLLFLSSGAVTRVYRGSLPSQLGVMLGLVVEVPLEEAGRPHRLVIRIVNRHGAELAAVQSTIRVGDQGLFPNEVQQVPMAVSLARVPVHTWGTHQVRIYLDDQLMRALTLYVVPSGGIVARPAAVEAPEAAEPAEEAAAPATAEAPEVAEPAEAPAAAETPDVAETPEVAEVPEVAEPAEVPVVAEVADDAEPAPVPDEQGVAEAPLVPFPAWAAFEEEPGPAEDEEPPPEPWGEPLPGLPGTDHTIAAAPADQHGPGAAPDVQAVLRAADALLASVGAATDLDDTVSEAPAGAGDTAENTETTTENEASDLGDDVAWLHDFHDDDATAGPGGRRDGEAPRDSGA